MVLDRYLVAKGLVGSFEVVLNKPLGQFPIEGLAVGRHIPHLDKLFIKCAVEPLLKRVVCRGPRAGEVVRKLKRDCGVMEVLRELAPVVGLEVLNLPLKKIVEPAEKISGMRRTMADVHAGKCDLGMGIDAG